MEQGRSNAGLLIAKRSYFSHSLNNSKIVLMSTFLLLFCAVFFHFYFNDLLTRMWVIKSEEFGGKILMYFGILLLVLNILFLLYLFIRYLKYQPIKSCSDEELPNCTVIVPSYNEGELVYKTLLSLARSDYPIKKLQIISIDDGSKDDTWQWMQKAKLELGNRVEILQQPENKGKRAALFRGFHRATGDIFITVDSDSIVREDTIRCMVSPFIKHEDCGAVAGNVRVLNKNNALIPRMLNVSFAYSFEFIRGAQSSLGAVFCTPGALSAYRRDAVMHCLPEWINQQFMGKKSTIGEDRAMTNMILKQGKKVLFQKNAYVYTNIPENYEKLHKMFTRWERSNIRETIAMSKFAFSSFRQGNKLGIRMLLSYYWLRLVLTIPALIIMFFSILMYPMLFVSGVLIGILAMSSVQALFYASKHNLHDSVWAYPYSLFYAFALFWIRPYAIFTANNGGWLTREIAEKANH